jgi:hypothetical protein
MPFRVTCATCGTRFALGDDLYERKIKNRIVTIRCRSCSSDISVDGVALAAGAAEPPGTESEPVLDSDAVPVAAKVPDLTPTVPLQQAGEKAAARAAAPAGESSAKPAGLWVVCCPEQDDRELTLPEIEAAIAKDEINGEAIVWRDGMAEWLPIHQVPELRVLLKRPPLPKPKGRTLLGIGAKPAAATATPKPLPARAQAAAAESCGERSRQRASQCGARAAQRHVLGAGRSAQGNGSGLVAGTVVGQARRRRRPPGAATASPHGLGAGASRAGENGFQAGAPAATENGLGAGAAGEAADGLAPGSAAEASDPGASRAQGLDRGAPPRLGPRLFGNTQPEGPGLGRSQAGKAKRTGQEPAPG